jgi:hypothetical protein
MNYNFDKFFEKKDDLGCLGITLMVIIVFAIAFGLLCFEVWVAMSLWNMLLVPMFGAPVITFWPMWGIMLLCNILFKTHNFNTNKKD